MKKVTTKYGMELTAAQAKAFRTIKKLIEHDEDRFATTTKDHLMADVFRSYFKEE